METSTHKYLCVMRVNPLCATDSVIRSMVLPLQTYVIFLLLLFASILHFISNLKESEFFQSPEKFCGFYDEYVPVVCK